MDPVTLGILAVAGILSAAAARRADDTEAPSSSTDGDQTTDDPSGLTIDTTTMTYNVEIWRATVTVVLLTYFGDQPVTLHMAWIATESGGNPAAVGKVGALDANGYPLESGIYQLYSPDEIKLAETTNAAMRAGAIGITQQMSRALTPDEMTAHVQAGATYIAKRRAQVDDLIGDAGWSERDAWRLVKCFHALTGLPRAGVAAATNQLGRKPSSWAEFRAACEGVDLSPYGGKGLARYAPYKRVLDNAEKVGGAVADS